MLERIEFDCFTRILKFPKLFVVVEYTAPRRMWDAHIFNKKCSEVPLIVTRNNYQDLLQSLAVFELIEQNGGLH